MVLKHEHFWLGFIVAAVFSIWLASFTYKLYVANGKLQRGAS